jgi:hypothetical protein
MLALFTRMSSPPNSRDRRRDRSLPFRLQRHIEMDVDRAAAVRVDFDLPVVRAGRRTQYAGGRTGPAPWLDRQARRRHRPHHSRTRAGLAGRLEEAEPLIQGAERTLIAEAQPMVRVGIYSGRATLELAYGRDAEALAVRQAPSSWPGCSPHRTRSSRRRGHSRW